MNELVIQVLVEVLGAAVIVLVTTIVRRALRARS